MKRITFLFLALSLSLHAADVKVSDLPAASALGGTEVFPIVQTTSKKATIAQVSTYTIAQAASTYAPLANPTFTGTVTIPSGASIAGYLTSASAASTYLTSATAATIYEPKDAKLTAFAALADAAGFFTSDGAGNYSWTGATIGGNGTADAGKAALFGTNGTLIARTYVRVTDGTDFSSLVVSGVSAVKSTRSLAILWPASPSANRQYTFPDATGTIHINGQALGTPASATLTNATGLPPSGVVGTAAILGANVFTGQQTFTANGAASTPAILYTGTMYTGGTGVSTTPLVYIAESTASASSTHATAGTMLGVNTHGSGRLLDLMLDGVSVFRVTFNGSVIASGSNTWSGTSAFNAAVTQSLTSQGTTPAAGLTVQSTTAATVGAQVESSPSFVLQGAGWKTNATAASQTVAFLQNVLPAAGTAAPSGTWQLQYSIAGGAAVNALTVASSGDAMIGTIAAGRTTAYRFRAINRMELSNDNGTTYQMGIGADFGSTFSLSRDYQITWSNNTSAAAGSRTLAIGRDSAYTTGVLQLGLNDATTPTNQTIKAHDVTTGTGADLRLSGGTGSAANGNVVPLTRFAMPAGIPFSVASGANARAGNATLVAGTVTVANTTVTANTLVFVSRKTAGGTVGNMTYTVSAGTSFTVTSSSGTDTSEVSYFLIENP